MSEETATLKDFLVGTGTPEHPEEYNTKDAAGGIKINRWDQFVESLRGASRESPVGFGLLDDSEGYLLRWKVQHDLEQELEEARAEKISAEEANSRWPGLPKPFSEPIYPRLAQLIADTQAHQAVDLNLVMGVFLITGLVAVVFNVVADIAYAALDPRIRLN